ncbi:MAG: hypothetical protein PSV36_02550 [Algoriphagus sp.]|nr:hypothetical protein [Algoriphagus sp.]
MTGSIDKGVSDDFGGKVINSNKERVSFNSNITLTWQILSQKTNYVIAFCVSEMQFAKFCQELIPGLLCIEK